MRYLILFSLLVSCNSVTQESKESEDSNIVLKTSIKFVSNRFYFDQRKMDTIIITNYGLHRQNRSIEVSGALIHLINEDSFQIKASQYYPDLKQVKFKINAKLKNSSQAVFDTISVPVQ